MIIYCEIVVWLIVHSINLDYNSNFLENGQVIIHFPSIPEHLDPWFSVEFEFH